MLFQSLLPALHLVSSPVPTSCGSVTLLTRICTETLSYTFLDSMSLSGIICPRVLCLKGQIFLWVRAAFQYDFHPIAPACLLYFTVNWLFFLHEYFYLKLPSRTEPYQTNL